MARLSPITCVASNLTLNSWEDLRDKLSRVEVAVFYSRPTGWQIRDEHGAIFTPQAFEAEYGYLPPTDFSWCHKHRRKQKIREWYAHRHQKTPSRGSGRGFGEC